MLSWGYNKDMPFAELDALYTHLLFSIEKRDVMIQVFLLSEPFAGESMSKDLRTTRKLNSCFHYNYEMLDFRFRNLSSVIDISNQTSSCLSW